MLSCRQVTERSSALLDGELNARERLAVRMHLLMCVHCRRFQRHLQSLVAALGRHEPSDSVNQVFVDRLLDRMDSATNGLDGPHRVR